MSASSKLVAESGSGYLRLDFPMIKAKLGNKKVKRRHKRDTLFTLEIFDFPSHPPCIVQLRSKVNWWWPVWIGRIVPLYECGEIPKRGCYALGDPR